MRRLRGPFQALAQVDDLALGLAAFGGLSLTQFFGGGVRRGIAWIGGVGLKLAESLLGPGDVVFFDHPHAKAVGRGIDA